MYSIRNYISVLDKILVFSILIHLKYIIHVLLNVMSKSIIVTDRHHMRDVPIRKCTMVHRQCTMVHFLMGYIVKERIK